MEEDLYFVSQGLLGNNTGNAQQVGPPKQQVTMDHSGSGDSVSNNVGESGSPLLILRTCARTHLCRFYWFINHGAYKADTLNHFSQQLATPAVIHWFVRMELMWS